MTVMHTPTPAPAPPLDHDSGPGGPRSLWTRWWFVASLGFLLLLVFLGIWLAVDNPDPTGPAPTEPAPAAAAPAPGKAAAGCGPAAGSQLPPVTDPGNDWTLLGSMAAPTATAVGPATSTRGIPACFAADPTGALFAAANFVAAASDPDLRFPAFQLATADGPGRNAALVSIAMGDAGTDTVGWQIAGFHVLSYTERRSATIDLLLVGSGQYLHLPVQTVFTGGDWRIVLPVTGRPFDQLMAVPDAAGYTPWQGA